MPDSEQLALFADDGDAPPAPPTLDALIQRARVSAATQAEGGAVGALVARLASGDGSAPVEVLRAEGIPAQVIASALLADQADKRVRPRAKVGIVAGEPFIWLTTSGWQAAGFASRRERHPNAESAEHAAAPAHLAGWLRQRLAPWPALRVEVATGAPCRSFSERVKALAWGHIQGGAGDSGGGIGVLTGGLLPDALLCETFCGNADLYASAWGDQPQTPEDAVEQTLALEVQRAARAEPLRWKVERWEAALRLGAVFAVVWVVRTGEVADRLRALGVGDPASRQLLVSAASVGLPGDEIAGLPCSWWPLRLRDEEAQ